MDAFQLRRELGGKGREGRMLKKADMRKEAPPEPPLAACPHFLLSQLLRTPKNSSAQGKNHHSHLTGEQNNSERCCDLPKVTQQGMG